MANELALGLVIGGAVSKTVGAAFKDVETRVKKLESTASRAKVLQSMIGETKQLQDEWRKAHASGAATADGLRRKLDASLDSLRRQGVEVRNLGKAYEQMGRKARSADLKATGHAQLKQGGAGLRNTAIATAGAAATTMIAPTKVSAEYNAMIRDIAIKAGIAGKPEEREMSNTIIGTSRDTGMARNEVADVVNGLVGAGMDLKKAMLYAPVAAKFVVGQGAEGTDTAKMINALGQNAKITDPKDMQKALEAIAFQGQAGSFEAADMAKWFPELLAGMGKLGITGNDAVAQLGSMLQVQMKTAGSSDEAANNLKNWMEKIGSTDVVKSYKDAGIDYQASLNTGLQKGMSTLESSFALAQKYVEKTDPKKAKAMSEAMAKISKEADPAKAKQMMTSLEQAMRTGDLFSDMQVKAALTAYMQNKELYQQLKKDSAGAAGILDKNLAERRDASAQMWKETGQAMDDALRSAGDAMRPLTDKLSSGLTRIGRGVADLSDKSPALVTGLLGVGAAIATISAAYSTFKMAKGLMNIGRGSLMGNPNVVQKVHVVNSVGGAGGPDLGGSGRDKAGERAKRRGGFWRRKGSPSIAAGKAPEVAAAAKPRVRVYSGGGPVPIEAPKPLSSWKPPAEAPKSSAVAVTSLVPTSAKPARMPHVMGGVRRADPLSAVVDAAIDAKGVYDTAKTKDEKAEGYGTVAGTMAGTMAGAAAGAAIGSVVPVIGTAIGALIGGMIGAQGGGMLGGVVGKSLFGGPDEAVASKAAPVTPLLMAQRPGPATPSLASMGAAFAPGAPLVTRNASAPDEVAKALRDSGSNASAPLVAALKDAPAKAAPKVDQKITLSPTFSITVQGDAKDPQALLNQMMPEIQRRLNEQAQQVARRDMTDDTFF
jgi:phage tail tape-measure protein